MMARKRFKKGEFYLTWREPVNLLTGLATGRISSNKRSSTSTHFNEPVWIPKNTRVMYVSRYKGPWVRVLYKDMLVQLHEQFLIKVPEFLIKTSKTNEEGNDKKG